MIRTNRGIQKGLGTILRFDRETGPTFEYFVPFIDTSGKMGACVRAEPAAKMAKQRERAPGRRRDLAGAEPPSIRRPPRPPFPPHLPLLPRLIDISASSPPRRRA